MEWPQSCTKPSIYLWFHVRSHFKCPSVVHGRFRHSSFRPGQKPRLLRSARLDTGCQGPCCYHCFRWPYGCVCVEWGSSMSYTRAPCLPFSSVLCPVWTITLIRRISRSYCTPEEMPCNGPGSSTERGRGPTIDTIWPRAGSGLENEAARGTSRNSVNSVDVKLASIRRN